jgi:hypothetical protein
MAHEGLWQQLAELDPELTAKRAKCRYTADQGQYVLSFLNKEYVVDVGRCRIFPHDHQQQEVSFLEQLCLLAYLIGAKDLPLADKLVRPESLPGGQFFFRGFHSLPTKKLETAFGRCPERLCEIAERFGAERCEFGDASIEMYLLPRIPVTIVIWTADDQFPARASILFDRTAADHLLLDALLTAASLAVDELTDAC